LGGAAGGLRRRGVLFPRATTVVDLATARARRPRPSSGAFHRSSLASPSFLISFRRSRHSWRALRIATLASSPVRFGLHEFAATLLAEWGNGDADQITGDLGLKPRSLSGIACDRLHLLFSNGLTRDETGLGIATVAICAIGVTAPVVFDANRVRASRHAPARSEPPSSRLSASIALPVAVRSSPRTSSIIFCLAVGGVYHQARRFATLSDGRKPPPNARPFPGWRGSWPSPRVPPAGDERWCRAVGPEAPTARGTLLRTLAFTAPMCRRFPASARRFSHTSFSIGYIATV